MGRRKQQFLKLLGYLVVDGNEIIGTSQAGGDLGKVERTLPGGKVKDKNNRICTQPMSQAKRDRITAWIAKKK